MVVIGPDVLNEMYSGLSGTNWVQALQILLQ